MKGGWVYIMTNRPNGILYTGVTSGLVKRVWEHREGVVDGFTKDYGLKRLVYFEFHDDIISAIQHQRDSAREEYQALAACLEGQPDCRGKS